LTVQERPVGPSSPSHSSTLVRRPSRWPSSGPLGWLRVQRRTWEAVGDLWVDKIQVHPTSVCVSTHQSLSVLRGVVVGMPTPVAGGYLHTLVWGYGRCLRLCLWQFGAANGGSQRTLGVRTVLNLGFLCLLDMGGGAFNCQVVYLGAGCPHAWTQKKSCS